MTARDYRGDRHGKFRDGDADRAKAPILAPGMLAPRCRLPTAVNPLGVKGAGQAGCVAAPQTIINAILDALAPLGIAHIVDPGQCA